MNKDIQELWKEITEHPDYIGGAIFVNEDIISLEFDLDPELVGSDTMSERMIEAGWTYIDSLLD